MIRNIAVLGAGHGGCAAAAHLGLRGLSVRLHARNEERLEPLRRQGGVKITGIHDGLVPIDLITTNLADAVRDANLIMLVVPSVAHEFYARGLASLLKEDQTVFLNPGHTGGGLNFVHELRQAGCLAQVRTCETVTLTYICRLVAEGHVHLYRYTTNLAFAAFPGNVQNQLYESIKPIYPEIRQATSVLETALTNINAVFHPTGMLMNAGWIEHTGGDFLFLYTRYHRERGTRDRGSRSGAPRRRRSSWCAGRQFFGRLLSRWLDNRRGAQQRIHLTCVP
jgi:opine dehydrogenase